MSTLTYVANGSDWEAVYVDGVLEAEQHLGRLWPNRVLKIIEENDISETETMQVDPDPFSSFPETVDGFEDWGTDDVSEANEEGGAE